MTHKLHPLAGLRFAEELRQNPDADLSAELPGFGEDSTKKEDAPKTGAIIRAPIRSPISPPSPPKISPPAAITKRPEIEPSYPEDSVMDAEFEEEEAPPPSYRPPPPPEPVRIDYEDDIPQGVVKISEDLSFPNTLATESLAVIAMRGAGKTVTTMVMAEEMKKNTLPFVIIDPLGVYWGLRSSADGEFPGLDIPILGGEHGDIVLEPTMGKAVARWISEYREPCILDLFLMRKGQQRAFMAEFAEELYAVSKRPLHIIVDEADLFIPQRPDPEQKKVLGAFEDIVRRGRSRGLGITVISQRPALLHKDILTQVGTLLVMRMTGPHDHEAVKDWIRNHDDEAKAKRLIQSLSSLDTGTAWVWSPKWLGVLKKIQIRQKRTWDSSRTPTVEDGDIPEPRVRAEVDVQGILAALGKAVKQDPNDPNLLKKRILELERMVSTGIPDGSVVMALQKKIRALENEVLAASAGGGRTISVDGAVLRDLVAEVREMNARLDILMTGGESEGEEEAEDPGEGEPVPDKKRKKKGRQPRH